jgi:hypothetical protein
MKWALMEMMLDGIGRLRTGFWRRERNWNPTFSRAAGKPTSPPIVGGLGEAAPARNVSFKSIAAKICSLRALRFLTRADIGPTIASDTQTKPWELSYDSSAR